jgi:hypothetical protein
MCFQSRPSHLSTRLTHITWSTMKATWEEIITS